MPPKRIPKDVKVWNQDLTRAAEYRYFKAGESSFCSISHACVFQLNCLQLWSCWFWTPFVAREHKRDENQWRIAKDLLAASQGKVYLRPVHNAFHQSHLLFQSYLLFLPIAPIYRQKTGDNAGIVLNIPLKINQKIVQVLVCIQLISFLCFCQSNRAACMTVDNIPTLTTCISLPRRQMDWLTLLLTLLLIDWFRWKLLMVPSPSSTTLTTQGHAHPPPHIPRPQPPLLCNEGRWSPLRPPHQLDMPAPLPCHWKWLVFTEIANMGIRALPCLPACMLPSDPMPTGWCQKPILCVLANVTLITEWILTFAQASGEHGKA